MTVDEATAAEPPRPWDFHETPVAGETAHEAAERRQRNRERRYDWDRWADARCADCGKVRLHVSHEMDPEHSPEGPQYHAEFAHHPFSEVPSDAR